MVACSSLSSFPWFVQEIVVLFVCLNFCIIYIQIIMLFDNFKDA